MSDLYVDEEQCKTVKSKMNSNLDAYTDTVNKVIEIEDSISSVWKGSKASDFMQQIENFLPNLTIGYNIIEKSKNDFSVKSNNLINEDQNV